MIFSCKTTEAFTFKLLINFLESAFDGFCLEVREKKLTICQTDVNMNTLVEVTLQAENFEYYRYTKDITIGLDLHNLNMLIKSIKKKDEVTLNISKDNPLKLNITISGQELGDNMMGSIRNQLRQRIIITPPRGYSKSCMVNSSKFQKACKDVMRAGRKIITLTSMGDYNMSIHSTIDDVGSNTIEFVNYPEISGNRSKIDVDGHRLLKLSKLTGMSSKLKIFLKEDTPILIKANVGSLGIIDVYIKK